MIWFAFYYRACPIELFGKYEADHLVLEGHERQGYFFVGT